MADVRRGPGYPTLPTPWTRGPSGASLSLDGGKSGIPMHGYREDLALEMILHRVNNWGALIEERDRYRAALINIARQDHIEEEPVGALVLEEYSDAETLAETVIYCAELAREALSHD